MKKSKKDLKWLNVIDSHNILYFYPFPNPSVLCPINLNTIHKNISIAFPVIFSNILDIFINQ